MSIELPQYSIQTTENRPRKLLKIFVPLIFIIGIAIGYFSSGPYANQMLKTLRERNNVLEDLNIKNHDVIAQQSNELSILKIDKKVKLQGILLLQNDYKSSIDVQNTLKAEIKFYERLLSPDAQNKGLRVFEASIKQRTDHSFVLKVILVQKIERAKKIAGSYNIQLIGKIKAKQKILQLSVNNDSKFDFKYFYTTSLNFSIPEGFKPEQLVVELLPKKKKAKTVRHTVDWQQLINTG